MSDEYALQSFIDAKNITKIYQLHAHYWIRKYLILIFLSYSVIIQYL